MCGDGIVAGTEGCDDMPPAEAGDGCSATCTVEPGFMCTGSPSTCNPLAVCGNGVVESGEACDQGGGNVAISLQYMKSDSLCTLWPNTWQATK
jgi:cysteine-rich repeat protein